jgi:hypothetical protein
MAFLKKVSESIGNTFQQIISSKARGDIERLEKQKECFQKELSLAEKKFFKHQIADRTFNEIREETHKQIIALEVEIESKKIGSKMRNLNSRQLLLLDDKRKYRVSRLSEQRKKIIMALQKAKEKYFKRKLDEKSYKEIVRERQKELIETEAKIAGVYNEQAKEIMKETEQALTVSEEKLKQATSEQIASEIFEQAPLKKAKRKENKKRMNKIF